MEATYDLRTAIIFDGISSQFHIDIFLIQFLAHIFLPVVFFLPKYGVNQGFRLNAAWTTWYAIYYNYLPPILVYAMVISYSLVGTDIELVEGAVFLPLIFFLQHRFMVACKYATLTRSEYERFSCSEDFMRALLYLNQTQLFSGWLHLDTQVMQYELGAASVRIGSRIDELSITIDNPTNGPAELSRFQLWNAFFRGHKVIDASSGAADEMKQAESGDYYVHLVDFCATILRHTMKGKYKRTLWSVRLTNTFGCIMILIPFVSIIYQVNIASENHSLAANHIIPLVVFILTSSQLNWQFSRIFFTLLGIAIEDVVRQYIVMRTLLAFIRVNDFILSEKGLATGSLAGVESEEDIQNRVQQVMMIGQSTNIQLQQDKQSELNTVTEQEIRRRVSSYAPTRNITQGDFQEHDIEVKENGTKKSVLSPLQLKPEVELNTIHNKRVEENGKDTNGKAKKKQTRSSVMHEMFVKDNDHTILPRINFNRHENVLAWANARLMFQSFGERFRYRLDINCIACLALLVVLMVLVLITLFLSEDSIRMATSPFFLQALVTLTMCVCFLLAMSIIGTAVNETLMSHNDGIYGQLLRLHTKMEKCRVNQSAVSRNATASEEDIKRIEDELDESRAVVEALESMSDILQSAAELRPYKFCGITAQSTVTMSICSTAISFYSIMITVLCGFEEDVLSAYGGDIGTDGA